MKNRKKKSDFFFENKFSASKNQKLQIVRNAFWQIFVPIGAILVGQTAIWISDAWGPNKAAPLKQISDRMKRLTKGPNNAAPGPFIKGFGVMVFIALLIQR